MTDPLYPLILTAFRTGMRQGELLGLRWECVDFAKREIRVERSLSRSRGEYRLSAPKTNSSRRTIPMGDQLAAVLEAHRKAQMKRPAKKDQGLVFCTPEGGPLDNSHLSQRFGVLCREAGVQVLPFHSARHTFATRLLQRGVSMVTVSRLLGHSTIATTVNVYGHVSEQDRRDAIGLLEVVG